MKSFLLNGVSAVVLVGASATQASPQPAADAKCFDKGSLQYVDCPQPVAPPPPAPVPAAVGYFTGFNVAAAIGYAWGSADIRLDWLNRYAFDVYERTRKYVSSDWSDYHVIKSQSYIDTSLADPANQHSAAVSDSIDLDGVLGEVKVGYDQEYGDYVLGAYASFGLTNYDGSGSVTLYEGANANVPWWRQGFVNTTRGATLDVQSDWLANVMARVGRKLDPRTLVFVTGGLAIQDFEAVITDERGSQVAKKTETLLGYSIGAGVERMINESLFVSLDYRYTDFGAMTLSGETSFIEDGASLMNGGLKQWGHLSENSYSAEIEPDMHAVRLSLGYRF